MNKKYLLLISIMFIIFFIIFNVNISYASNISDIIQGGDGFIAAGTGAGIDQNKLKGTSNLIYNILLIIGMAVAVVMAGVLGIKFMMGTVEEKAQIKEQLIPFIVGCVVVFGAFSIWKIVVTIGSQI